MANSEIRELFPTPILVREIDEAPRLNAAIAKEVLKREDQSESIGRSNVKGWHSEDDFFAWDLPEIQELLVACKKGVEDMTRELATSSLWASALTLYGWANVLRAGSYNAAHDHSECAWAGVYYVQTGVVDPKDGASGRLEFVDPRTAVTGGFAPGEPLKAEGFVTPRDGTLVIFPGWLKHIVYPFASDGDGVRISIAFNAHFDRHARLKQGSKS